MKKAELGIGLAILLVVIALVMGGAVGYLIMPTKTIIDTSQVSQLSNQLSSIGSELTACLNKPDVVCPVLAVEVCPVETSNETPVEDFSFRDAAVLELMKEKVLEDNDLLYCDGYNNNNEYDFDQISISKKFDSFSVDAVDKLNYDVTAKVKLKYKQTDLKQCFNVVEFTVSYVEDEKPEVEIL